MIAEGVAEVLAEARQHNVIKAVRLGIGEIRGLDPPHLEPSAPNRTTKRRVVWCAAPTN